MLRDPATHGKTVFRSKTVALMLLLLETPNAQIFNIQALSPAYTPIALDVLPQSKIFLPTRQCHELKGEQPPQERSSKRSTLPRTNSTSLQSGAYRNHLTSLLRTLQHLPYPTFPSKPQTGQPNPRGKPHD